MGQRICGWNFKHWESDSARMNLINLPMIDSTVYKKLTDKSAKLQDAETDKSKGSQKRSALPVDVETALSSMGICKKTKVEHAQSEPTAHQNQDDEQLNEQGEYIDEASAEQPIKQCGFLLLIQDNLYNIVTL